MLYMRMYKTRDIFDLLITEIYKESDNHLKKPQQVLCYVYNISP